MMSLGQPHKKMVLNGGSTVSFYVHSNEISKQHQHHYQPNLAHTHFPRPSPLGEMFQRCQAEIAQILNNTHFMGCSGAILQRSFPIFKAESVSADELTMRYDYTSTIQLHNQVQQFQEFFDTKRKTIEIKKKRPPSKNVQSKFKNIYGLVVGRVIKTCKEYFRAKEEQGIEDKIITIEDGRFKYIHEGLNSKRVDLETFRKYLDSYYNRDPELKKKRGKFIVQEYLMQDPDNGWILADLIIMFLDKGNSDFQNYTDNDTKQKNQILKVLLNDQDREKLSGKFEDMKTAIKEKSSKYVKINKEEEMG